MLARYLLVPLISLVIMSWTSCATNPVTGKREFSLISESMEKKIGEQYYGPTIQSFDGKYPSEWSQAYVSQVGNRLAALSHRPNLNYEFTVVNTSMVNAFALPGGKICVTRGLLSKMTHESQLAAVLGHEVGHVTARHGARAMTRQLVLGGVMALGATALEYKQVKGRNLMMMGAALGFQAVIAKYSRGQESQSDELGLQYMTKANYNPQGAVELFNIFASLQKHEPSFVERMFLSHPQSKHRKAHARKLIQAKYSAIAVSPSSIKNTAQFSRLSAQLKREAPYYAHHEKGTKAASNGFWDQAISHYKKALKGMPNEPLFNAEMGYAYLMKRDYYKSEKYLNKAHNQYRDFFKPRFYLGYLHYQRRDYRNAKSYLESADKLAPGIPLLRLMLGESHEWSGDSRKAEKYYKYVYQSAPKTQMGQEARSHLVRLRIIR